MSGSVNLATSPLTSAERVDVRRFCGYPAFGNGVAGSQSWRFFAAYGLLEFRLTNLSAGELQVVRQYLGSLYGLETGIVGAATNLDTERAAVWTRNSEEVPDRINLFDAWRWRLAAFLGVPLDPGTGMRSAIVI